MKTSPAYVKIGLMMLLASLIGCTEEQPTDIFDVDTRYEQFYWIMSQPEWPDGTIPGTYTQTQTGAGFIFTPDSLYWENESWPVVIKRNGAEVWMRTPGGAHTFRGDVSQDIIKGYMIAEGVNGRPGPIIYMTLRRAH